jgi:2-iminobutanoate/2-iminopropanoate deaminase
LPKTIPETPSAPQSLAPYSAAAEAAGLVFLAGQVGLDPKTGEKASDDVEAQTRQVMSNIGAVLDDLGLGYEDIVKTTIFLADIGDFATVNDVYASYFEADFPARTTVQAGALPGGFLVEIEVVAAR